jgi:hypothetical protein
MSSSSLAEYGAATPAAFTSFKVSLFFDSNFYSSTGPKSSTILRDFPDNAADRGEALTAAGVGLSLAEICSVVSGVYLL